MDGTTCASPSSLQSFGWFDYKNVVIYVYGDKRSDLMSNTGTLLAQYVDSVNRQNSTTFLYDFNQALSGAGVLTAFKTITLQLAQTFNAPTQNLNTAITVKSRDTAITVSGLVLSSGPGIFYAIADSANDGAPTRSQVRIMNNAVGDEVPGTAEVTAGSAVTLVLTQLEPNTLYNVWYYGTNSDPTQYAAVTAMQNIKVKTKAPGIGFGASKLEMNLVLILVVALSALML